MSDNETTDYEKLKEGKTTEATPFNLKECADALRDTYNKGYAEGLAQQKCEGDTDEHETNTIRNEEEEEITKIAEYDDEHMKELHSEMTIEQLEELKDKSSVLKNSGNAQYKNSCFTEAVDLYTQALNCCPLKFSSERSILYANRSAAYIGLDNKKTAVEDCTKALNLNPTYLRALLRRAQLYRKMDNLDQALEDYKKVVEIDPTVSEARQACMVLPEEINERNEKLKTEMLGKLKDLGNIVLRPFGLSTENFKMVQDPNSGGYSINFQNNPQN